MTRARGWPALAALAVLLAGVAGVDAGHEPGPTHALVVEQAVAQLAQGVDLGQAVVDYALGPPEPTGGPFCEESVVRVDAAAGRFTFDDNATGDGCAEVRLTVRVPPGAGLLRVRFEANRAITRPADAGSVLVQQFRLQGDDGQIDLSTDYYDPASGPAPDFAAFQVEEPLGQGRANVTLVWLFDDRGLQGERLSSLQDFDATVQAIALEWPDVRLPQPAVAVGPEVRQADGNATANITVLLDVGAAVLAGQSSASVTVTTRHGPALAAVRGPGNATLAAGEFLVEEGPERTVAGLPATAVARLGAGEYTFTYVSTRTLPPVPPTPEPTRIWPFFATLALLPAPPAALALYSAFVYRREAEGRYRRASAGVLTLVLVAALYYLLLLAYALLGAGRSVMTTLPLKPQATLVYVQLIVLMLFFVVVAVVVGRYLVRGMREDLEARRRQEDKLRRSNEELERFAYVASHDLQEPLRKVAGFTSLLQRRYKGRLDKDADEMIQYAVDGATRMQALIRDILAYSRVGSAELDIKPVETAALMELVVSDQGERIQETRAAVTWDALPTVAADPLQLRQVLQNLVENAIKYHDPRRRPKVRVSAERMGPHWRFAVADNGIGIPADKLQDVFGIFRRLHGSEVPGTGIGLALAKKAIERHGGRIWAESKPGRGSTFYFTLPASEGAAPTPGAWRAVAEGLRPGQPTGVPPA